MLVFSTIYFVRLLTLIILWILGHCYLVAQLYLHLGSVPRYYLGLNEKVKIKSCFLMCCRTSCSKKHLFIMLRNRFLSHRTCGGWLAFTSWNIAASLERAVQIHESSYLILWASQVWKLCSVTELIGFIPLLQCSVTLLMLSWHEQGIQWGPGYGYELNQWIWIIDLKTQRLEVGLLLIMRAVGSETASGGVLETKPDQ